MRASGSPLVMRGNGAGVVTGGWYHATIGRRRAIVAALGYRRRSPFESISVRRVETGGWHVLLGAGGAGASGHAARDSGCTCDSGCRAVGLADHFLQQRHLRLPSQANSPRALRVPGRLIDLDSIASILDLAITGVAWPWLLIRSRILLSEGLAPKLSETVRPLLQRRARFGGLVGRATDSKRWNIGKFTLCYWRAPPTHGACRVCGACRGSTDISTGLVEQMRLPSSPQRGLL